MKKIAIVGIGGYAEEHLRSIGILEKEGSVKLCAAVVWRDRHTETRKSLEKNGVVIFHTFDELMYAQADIDIVSIPTGIMWHEEMITRALQAGYHVMCEKPLTGTVVEARRICNVVEETGRICAIGYQNMYSHSIARIKDIRVKKQLGGLLSARTLVMWPRSQAYYQRNEWAGELEFGGKRIYDSIAQNACAHFLQNMLFIAGEGQRDSAELVSVYGENYRAKNIASADTQFIRVHTRSNVELVFVGTHCVMEEYGPVTDYQFERGRVRWQMGGKTAVYDKNGKIIEDFDNRGEDFKTNIFRNLLESIDGNTQPKCTPANAMQQTVVIENAFASSGGIVEIPQAYKEIKLLNKSFYSQVSPSKPDPNAIIADIESICNRAVNTGESFSELGIPWAVESKEIKV